ncbi:hypothetical protein TH25_17340 [Thalassospira profundimaris]|uniref:Uncharacterized protein n=1 Tax=Thalassospira profundimaris TaxID=502049 RepID=A0A367WX69_9PROT|nr:hypothetical protein [Thalassospira profundimaris]RCK45988.1 hypothetical protein TH25_17340 [Thalassospira profundimaris]
MNEKLLAGLVAALAIAPLCAVCILGPAVIASIFTGIAAGLGGFDVVVTVGLALVAGVAAVAIVRNRRVRHAPAKPAGEMN